MPDRGVRDTSQPKVTHQNTELESHKQRVPYPINMKAPNWPLVDNRRIAREKGKLIVQFACENARSSFATSVITLA